MENKLAIQINGRTFYGLDLKRSFGGHVNAKLKKARKSISHLADTKERLTKKRVRAQQEVDERTARWQRKSAMANKRFEEYQRANARYEAAGSLLAQSNNKTAQIANDLDGCARMLSSNRSFITDTANVFGGDSYDRRAVLLRSIMPMIDTREKVSIKTDQPGRLSRPGEYEDTMSWRTGDTYILDADGSPLPCNFGKFDIKVILSHGNRGNYIKVICHNRDPTWPTTGSERYWHPHVNEDGIACLGNAARMLIEHMKHSDYAMVVYVVTEYLIKYNPESPYIKLSNWVANRFECAVCAACNELYNNCGCLRCSITNNVITEDERAPCGASYSACMVHHSYNPDDTDGGVNGTGCQFTAYPELLRSQE